MSAAHPGETCNTPGCRDLVGWSDAAARYAKLCEKHLALHRQRNKVCNLRRKQGNQEIREQAARYEELLQHVHQLSEENRKLRQQLSKHGPIRI